MRRRALTRFSVISGCVLVHSLNLGRTRRALRPLALKKPRLSGHLQAQAQAMASRDEADSIQAPLLDKATATEALLASDEVATEEQRKKTIRREQNQLDIEGMNAELDVYKTNVKGEDAEDLWKKEFLEFKNGLMLNRARMNAIQAATGVFFAIGWDAESEGEDFKPVDDDDDLEQEPNRSEA